MKNTPTKTNAMRLLDGRGIAYQIFTFSPEIHSGDEVAAAVSEPASTVYKTLVVLRTRGKNLLVMLPSDQTLDLKKLAMAIGEKKLEMAPHRRAEELTGLQVGGISALALLGRPFDVCIASKALQHTHILVSAGKRGVNLRLGVTDLIHITDAEIVDLT
jgi:Cys-tRNA(Pro)/Cys-tRNA(Cys) deacylase